MSVRSDIYSLGLILYEGFTGNRAFEDPAAPRELSAVRPPSSSLRQLGAQTEQAMLKCLEPHAPDRPASALELAAMLPGADPLAAAGHRRAFAATKAFACLGAIALGLIGFAALRAPPPFGRAACAQTTGHAAGPS